MSSERQFVEHIGQLFERDGMPRIAGRVFGDLLLSNEARSLESLAEGLEVSKASVSTNARLLEGVGMVERVTFPGDRRDYYEVPDSAYMRMLELRLQRFLETRRLLEEGLGTAAASDLRIRRRLEVFREFFDRMIGSITEARDRMAERGSGETE